MKQLSAIEWLLLVSYTSPNTEAKSMARFGLQEWRRLKAHWALRDVKTNRALWDLLAGVFECHQNITHHTTMTEVVSGDEKFYFPIFVEACERRAKNANIIGAIVANVPVRSERLPQTGKFGNVVCKT